MSSFPGFQSRNHFIHILSLFVSFSKAWRGESKYGGAFHSVESKLSLWSAVKMSPVPTHLWTFTHLSPQQGPAARGMGLQELGELAEPLP